MEEEQGVDGQKTVKASYLTESHFQKFLGSTFRKETGVTSTLWRNSISILLGAHLGICISLHPLPKDPTASITLLPSFPQARISSCPAIGFGLRTEALMTGSAPWLEVCSSPDRRVHRTWGCGESGQREGIWNLVPRLWVGLQMTCFFPLLPQPLLTWEQQSSKSDWPCLLPPLWLSQLEHQTPAAAQPHQSLQRLCSRQGLLSWLRIWSLQEAGFQGHSPILVL